MVYKSISKPVIFHTHLLALLILSLIAISVTGCVAGRGNMRTEKDSGRTSSSANAAKVYIGVASFYGEEFAGRKTYSGEVYEPMGLTAAHQFLPMGTLLKITNMKNNRTIEVRINDRMPYHADRIIDLSKGAARELGMLQDGLVKVRIEVIEPGENR